jgi:general secretion pathway protein G
MQRSNSSKSQQGFTLMEILIVITIIGILMGVVAMKMTGHTERAEHLQAQMNIKALGSALRMFKMDNSFYPTTEQGLRALVEKPSIGRVPNNWREGGYLEENKIPKDPWGFDYHYQCPGTHNPQSFDLWSYGADNQEGSQQGIENEDVTNWETEKPAQ